jgi:hypothetical protein
MAKRTKKTVGELKIPKEIMDNQPSSYLAAADLEKQLDMFGKDVVSAMTYGTMPELLNLSWDMYDKFKRGEIQDMGGTDDELRRFFDFKKKDLIIKLLGFMDLASTSLLDPDKAKYANLRDLTASLKVTLDMLNALHGTSIAKKVEHTHTHKLEDVKDIDARLEQTRQELEAIEAEYEDVEDGTTF